MKVTLNPHKSTMDAKIERLEKYKALCESREKTLKAAIKDAFVEYFRHCINEFWKEEVTTQLRINVVTIRSYGYTPPEVLTQKYEYRSDPNAAAGLLIGLAELDRILVSMLETPMGYHWRNVTGRCGTIIKELEKT